MKLVLAPGLVVVMTLAGRRWGDRTAGVLGGLPVVVGPILLAFALDHGSEFAARAAGGALSGLVALCAFMLAYGWCARATWWLPALAAGWSAFAAAALLLDRVTLAIGGSLTAVALCFMLTHALLPRDRERRIGRSPGRWDIPMRVATTILLVLTLTGAARVLGPHLSGLLAAFPVLASVLSAFTHAHGGAAATAEFLRGLVMGLGGFATFCFVLALLLPATGVAIAFLCGSVAALAVNAAVMAVAPGRVASPAIHATILPPR